MKSEYTGIHFYLFLLVLKILKLNNMLIQKKKKKTEKNKVYPCKTAQIHFNFSSFQISVAPHEVITVVGPALSDRFHRLWKNFKGQHLTSLKLFQNSFLLFIFITTHNFEVELPALTLFNMAPDPSSESSLSK